MSGLTDDDWARLKAIQDADEVETVQLIYEYYRDFDRAERTPREFLYLHLGMISAIAIRVPQA